MNSAEAADANVPLPRENLALLGHEAAELEFLTAYRGARIPHAWLITGEAGIGKATLAYRMARFVLAYPVPSLPAVQAATSLALDARHPTVRRVAGNAHPDLLVLERTRAIAASCAASSPSTRSGAW